MALSVGGREFQSSGPYTLKERVANVFFLVKGTFSSRSAFLEAALVDLGKDLVVIKLANVGGAWSLRHLNTRQAILKSILSAIGSQCSSLRARVALSNLDRPSTTLAAQFWTRCSGLIDVAGNATIYKVI